MIQLHRFLVSYWKYYLPFTKVIVEDMSDVCGFNSGRRIFKPRSKSR